MYATSTAGAQGYSKMIPKDHPRAESLHTREMLVDGFRRNLVVAEGLIAHGRGEAFDYLIGERTDAAAKKSDTRGCRGAFAIKQQGRAFGQRQRGRAVPKRDRGTV